MKSKRVSDSSVVMAVVMEPADANPAGNVHGGVIMKNIDSAGGVVALRHAAGNAVTASIDRLDFHNPVYVGELLFLKAGINLVGKSSMEIGVRVEAENPRQGQTRHVASAYLTFVALDENKRPASVPGLIMETADERRRNAEAMSRRNLRLAEKVREKQSRAKGGA
ncbi:MAG: acyl-CoA thioesterase [Proteobacteria bacterium]|nr:acyl-CoA thioesterase [Pseudomonadota bacterium]MBU1450579.1 acyl-CoA thioesterase [Pseudomonadota bacterium]MBU2469157.1 acyl-CoA thioesterase [Pseudomonadota bacterium]MBU2519548.1 acyl-CoA thioesterase [Pseudomonadota bacterium]